MIVHVDYKLDGEPVAGSFGDLNHLLIVRQLALDNLVEYTERTQTEHKRFTRHVWIDVEPQDLSECPF